MNNRQLGQNFENLFCEILYAQGFWVHNFAQKTAGQPADVIAVKNGKSYLIDCKVCSSRGFALSRIEENQHYAMHLWWLAGNGTGWFALKQDNDIYMFSYDELRKHNKSLSPADIREGRKLDEWLSERGV